MPVFVTLEDNTPLYVAASLRAEQASLDDSSDAMTEIAKWNAPVYDDIATEVGRGRKAVPGELRDSLAQLESTKDSRTVGTRLWYSIFTEFGTSLHGEDLHHPADYFWWPDKVHPFVTHVNQETPAQHWFLKSILDATPAIEDAFIKDFSETLNEV